MKKNAFLIFICLILGINIAAIDPTFELENKTNGPIYLSIGTTSYDPMKLSFTPVGPNDVIPQFIDNKNIQTVIAISKKSPIPGDQILKVTFPKNKKMYISVTADNTILNVVPQTKDSKTSTYWTSRNARGYSLSGNVSTKEIQKQVVTFMPMPTTPQEAAAILNVSLDASLAVKKKAYRALLLQWHPDKNVDREKATEMTKRIIRAAEILGIK